ncbi:hypothetical protein ISV75_001705 [Campylobacter jejuni]|uniref:Pentapeptide repeat-containing protein n=1 Tax=Campylobacter jejuni TaxID=197 RepID=A0AAX1Z240_CAMJU|nr:hypothetical protein [Campylobacter jejuni]EAH4711996.1 hypothetical protein [Campylobacter jejuni]EAI2546640.1 hypothetical protein [Campylobacter jejuni]EAI6740894.1 hypothetical protein [Campylobacter jejuni]EAK5593657.1 hypothetical protein [Campylobacter jejuni]EAL0605135.1 hypothetical protein [Campylobacter jejuni]
MNHDEKNSRLRSIVEKLCKEQIFSDVGVVIEDLSEIYQEGFKHNYSELTTIILNATKNDPEQDLMILAQNLRGLEEKLNSHSQNAKLEIANLQDIKSRIAKFYDHVNLECVRLQDSSEKISRLQNTYKELDKNYKELDKNYKELDKNYKELSENLNKQQTQYITILGIFASIVLTFVSGLVFSNSILSNIDKASIYRLVFVMAFIALFVGNILYFLFAFLIKISLNIHFQTNRLLIIFNIIILAIMLIDFMCYLFNIKTIDDILAMIDFIISPLSSIL